MHTDAALIAMSEECWQQWLDQPMRGITLADFQRQTDQIMRVTDARDEAHSDQLT